MEARMDPVAAAMVPRSPIESGSILWLGGHRLLREWPALLTDPKRCYGRRTWLFNYSTVIGSGIGGYEATVSVQGCIRGPQFLHVDVKEESRFLNVPLNDLLE